MNGVGAIVVAGGLYFGSDGGTDVPLAVLVISLVALAAWVARAFVRETRLGDALIVVMLLGGTSMTQATNGLLITPAIIAVLAITVDQRHSLAVGSVFAVVGAAIVTTTSIVSHRPLSFLLGVLGGLAIGFVIGFNRRQTRIAAERERELLALDVEIEREQERSSLLADRARVARDIHDVLAHSLGGLVIQLDAVEALLENGRVEDAAARVSAARQLAAEGLGEARRAVATLRDPESDPAAAPDSLDGPDAVDRLLTAHEQLGGRTVVTGRAALEHLDAAHARAVAGVLREALSNARRHAPGETVTLDFSLDARRGILRLRVSNPVPVAAPPVDSAGGGHGLPGMRERMTELGDASSLEVKREGETFVIEAEVVAQ